MKKRISLLIITFCLLLLTSCSDRNSTSNKDRNENTITKSLSEETNENDTNNIHSESDNYIGTWVNGNEYINEGESVYEYNLNIYSATPDEIEFAFYQYRTQEIGWYDGAVKAYYSGNNTYTFKYNHDGLIADGNISFNNDSVSFILTKTNFSFWDDLTKSPVVLTNLDNKSSSNDYSDVDNNYSLATNIIEILKNNIVNEASRLTVAQGIEHVFANYFWTIEPSDLDTLPNGYRVVFSGVYYPNLAEIKDYTDSGELEIYVDLENEIMYWDTETPVGKAIEIYALLGPSFIYGNSPSYNDPYDGSSIILHLNK